MDLAHESAQNRAAALFYRGLAHESAGDRDKALADQEEASRLDPQLPGPHLVRGRYHAERGNHYAAIRAFDEVLGLNPASAPALERRGNAYLAMGSFETALRDFEAALRIDRSRVGAYAGRRKAYEGLGQDEEAWRSDPLAWTYGCGVSWQSGANDEALERCNEALAIWPEYPMARWFRALLHMTARRHEAAIIDLDQFLKPGQDSRIDQSVPTAFGMRGLAHLGLGRYDAAISDLSAALRLEPEDPPLFLYARGLARQRSGDAAGGVADFAAVTRDHAEITSALAKFGIR